MCNFTIAYSMVCYKVIIARARHFCCRSLVLNYMRVEKRVCLCAYNVCVLALEILHYALYRLVSLYFPFPVTLLLCSFGYAKLCYANSNVIVFISTLHIGFLHPTLLVKRQLNFKIIIITIMIMKQQLYEAHADTYKIWIFTIYMTRKKNNSNNISFTRERNANDKNNMSYNKNAE